jgi:hypothetical protein
MSAGRTATIAGSHHGGPEMFSDLPIAKTAAGLATVRGEWTAARIMAHRKTHERFPRDGFARLNPETSSPWPIQINPSHAGRSPLFRF